MVMQVIKVLLYDGLGSVIDQMAHVKNPDEHDSVLIVTEPGRNAASFTSRPAPSLLGRPMARGRIMLLPDLPEITCDFSGLRELDRQDESLAVATLLASARQPTSLAARTHEQALQLIRSSRSRPPGIFAEFLSTWRLSTTEGRTLMALAEALLRIPDTGSADRLINDLLTQARWTLPSHESSLGMKVAGWGLAAGAHFIREEDLPDRAHQLLLTLGDAVFRPALAAGLRLMAGQFVMGKSVADALSRREPGLRYSFDCLGEAAQTAEDVDQYTAAYLAAIKALSNQGPALPLLARDGISIKLSALHPCHELRKWSRVRPELGWRLSRLLLAAAEGGIPVTLDAEECDRLELTLLLYREALLSPALEGWSGLGIAVQAYQKRAPAVLDWLGDLAKQRGHPLSVRLVKGAYWDTEIKRAQQLGLSGYPVYTRKHHTDVSYLACARKMLAAPQCFHAQFATHNAQTLAWLEVMATAMQADFERQRLAGMGNTVHEAFASIGDRPLRVYAPVGQFNTLLPYLVRRLLENGSSQSFVNQLANPATDDDALAQNPVDRLDTEGVHPHPRLPLPQHIFPDRPNSPGFTLADIDSLQQLKSQARHAMPVAAHSLPEQPASETREIRRCFNPASRIDVIGSAEYALPEDMQHAATASAAAFPAWSRRPVRERADVLRRLAQLLLEHRAELVSLLVREAGKTIGDALAEWREAFDYCHYYASEGERLMAQAQCLPAISGELNELGLHGRGVMLCISPWNFPLAIFLGQVAAALVTGNTVIAKPASQTPLIAFRVTELACQAGVPPDTLQLLIASGASLQEQLLPHPALAGVVFTGSVAVATTLSRCLAAREGARLPLIAETGGLNVMIADSTALPEQLVNDIMISAFNSAGQRCSALRVLWLQQDIAEVTLERLKGVLLEWQTGSPHMLSVDMGPVIDEDSALRLRQTIQHWQSKARWMARGSAGPESTGHFILPHAFLLEKDDLPREEVFGPVLAICTWKQGELAEVVNWINHSGYGLTLGVHSRLDSTLHYVRTHARVGNLYENRNQIGATVGCQPFGGEGLSGTGFKAGGPHYLLRLVTERTITTNLAATGVNTGLLGLDD